MSEWKILSALHDNIIAYIIIGLSTISKEKVVDFNNSSRINIKEFPSSRLSEKNYCKYLFLKTYILQSVNMCLPIWNCPNIIRISF